MFCFIIIFPKNINKFQLLDTHLRILCYNILVYIVKRPGYYKNSWAFYIFLKKFFLTIFVELNLLP